MSGRRCNERDLDRIIDSVEDISRARDPLDKLLGGLDLYAQLEQSGCLKKDYDDRYYERHGRHDHRRHGDRNYNPDGSLRRDHDRRDGDRNYNPDGSLRRDHDYRDGDRNYNPDGSLRRDHDRRHGGDDNYRRDGSPRWDMEDGPRSCHTGDIFNSLDRVSQHRIEAIKNACNGLGGRPANIGSIESENRCTFNSRESAEDKVCSAARRY